MGGGMALYMRHWRQVCKLRMQAQNAHTERSATDRGQNSLVYKRGGFFRLGGGWGHEGQGQVRDEDSGRIEEDRSSLPRLSPGFCRGWPELTARGSSSILAGRAAGKGGAGAQSGTPGNSAC